MQLHAVTDQTRGQNITFNKLPDNKHAGNQRQWRQFKPKLTQPQRPGQHQAKSRADIGNKTDEPGKHADNNAALQPDQRQANRINRAQ